MRIGASVPLHKNNAGFKSLKSMSSKTKYNAVRPDKDFANLKNTVATSEKLNSLKFGASDGENDVQFSELKEKSKLYAKKKYKQTKEWFKKKSDEQGTEKKDAAIAAGTGIAAGVAAESLIGGMSGGLFGATVAAFTGYKMHKHHQQKRQEQEQG